MAAKQNCGRVCKTFRLIKSVVTIPEIRNLYVTLYKFSTRQRTVNLSFFIARRMAQPAPGNKPGVMERIAVVSVALGMAVMILAMAVIMGFKREVARKMTGFAAHVAVTDIRGVNALDAQPVRRSAHVEELIRRTDGFVAMAPYAVKGGIVRTADAVGEVMLKGVEADYDWSYFREWLVAGELPRVGGEVRTKDILLSRTLADKLLLGVGDKVEMLFVEPGEMPRRDRFKVAGVYESGMEEMDGVVVVTDIRNVQRLSEWATGRDFGLRDPDDARWPAPTRSPGRWAGRCCTMMPKIPTNLAVTSVRERYANIFDWLKAHDVNAAVVIVIMLVVAFFNMTSALLILVLERTRMIGLLKAFGMRNGCLRRIFLWRAALVTLRGLAWGNAAGLGLCLVQKCDASGEAQLRGIPALGGARVAGLGLVAGAQRRGSSPRSSRCWWSRPAVVSTVKPDETIRYE